MLDIELLEKRWLIYKLKTKIPYILFGIFLIVFYIFGLIVLEIEKRFSSSEQVKKEKKVVVKKVKVEPKKISVQYVPVVLEPSFDFLKRMQTETVVYAKEVIKQEVKKTILPKVKPLVKVLPMQEEIKVEEKKVEKKEIASVKEVIKEEKKPLTLQIRREKKETDLADVVARFNKNNNPVLSLFIARKYYEQGMYDKAYNYALITNKLDSNLEESWIIFVKALVKLDKKDIAIDVLQKYIAHTDSQEASLLLENIEKGTLK